jgi:hypothetical protein
VPAGLDFIVIGTQKGGTTTLWRHLQSHPDLWLPPSKEAPFFSHDEVFAKGFDWYTQEFFSRSPESARLGTVTPHYMMGTADADVPEIARRIRAAVPRVRLIALLRDPIQRALSHYRMAVYRGREARSCDAALSATLEPATLDEARHAATETNSYIAQGEYGRILAAYLEVFPRHRIHIALTDELEALPRETMRDIFEFLDVDDRHELPDPHARDHRGGVHRRVDTDSEQGLKEYLATSVWPDTSRAREQRRAFDFFFKQWNVLVNDELPTIDADLRRALARHFAHDAEELERTIGLSPEWAAVPSG